MTGLLQGYDLFIVLALVALLFGASQLPKLARSLGSASHEFKRGQEEGAATVQEATRAGEVKEAAPANGTPPKQLDHDEMVR